MPRGPEPSAPRHATFHVPVSRRHKWDRSCLPGKRQFGGWGQGNSPALSSALLPLLFQHLTEFDTFVDITCLAARDDSGNSLSLSAANEGIVGGPFGPSIFSS